MAVTDEAIGKIKDMLIRGELKAGDRLPPEKELSERLGLSRSSLREAVKALELTRVLDVRRGDGTYVTSLDAKLLNKAVAFVVDLHYAGLFTLANIPPEHVEPLLLVESPRLLFPFARRIVADATRDGGMPPLMLSSICRKVCAARSSGRSSGRWRSSPGLHTGSTDSPNSGCPATFSGRA